VIDKADNKPAAGSELQIEKWVYGGAGLGRLEGRVVLTPFVLPGERVRIEVEREKSSMVEARAVEWLERSPERVEPACRYFERCGGCHYQHAPYEYQAAQKVEIVREVLRRVGKVEAPAEIGLRTGEPLGYRNRSQFHLRGARIGYLAAGSHDLVPVDECPISAPAINEALAVLKKSIKDRRWPRFVEQIELFTNGEETMVNVLETEGGRRAARGFFDWLGERIPGAELGEINYRVGEGKFRVSYDSFFQVNRFLVEGLVEEVLGEMAGETALDLYAGVGLFSLPLAKRFGKVTAVESSPSAVHDLQYNAAEHGVEVDAQRMQAEQHLAGLTAAPEVIVADPPRSGLGKNVTKHLARLKAPKLVLVSCDPATLARDLGALTAAGYGLTRMTVVDLFPQTFHVEVVVELGLV
jgi:23S rRNA (uracil1939-C5)-methyltransferase